LRSSANSLSFTISGTYKWPDTCFFFTAGRGIYETPVCRIYADCALGAVPAAAFEVKDPNREKPQLKIELEPAPSQVQRDFDQYVQELAK
jgi:hypothetical protein